MNLFFVLSYFLLGFIIASVVHFNIEKVLDDPEDIDQYRKNTLIFFGFMATVGPIALVCMLIINIVEFIKSSFGGKK